jgi:hypothetical protein
MKYMAGGHRREDCRRKAIKTAITSDFLSTFEGMLIQVPSFCLAGSALWITAVLFQASIPRPIAIVLATIGLLSYIICLISIVRLAVVLSDDISPGKSPIFVTNADLAAD